MYSLYSVEHNTPAVGKSYDAITGGMPMLSNLLMGKWRKKNGIPKVKSFEHYTEQNGRTVHELGLGPEPLYIRKKLCTKEQIKDAFINIFFLEII